MSTAVHLRIISDRPELASRALLGCSVAALPGFMQVVSDPLVVQQLESGSSAMGVFFPSDMGKPSFIEMAWRERRERGGIDDDAGKHLEKLSEWMRRRDEVEQQYIAQARADEMKNKEGAIA